ncbi:hypothetical protein [Nostoc sp. MS1]|uniref:hypothetical protein n=1 Tax=Nostoc sp. MS1 TaxID=2764711 RepID=UPI001CC3DB65|nr:hypothetical protein [Nostoc sp. MS1]BCL39214.1 hypothetical protein NSMS1_56610 [Nostoc sp. MS1]
MNHLSRFLVVSTAIALASFTPALAKAATITYDVQVAIDSGPLNGKNYKGFFSYDDSSLTGIGDEAIALSNFGFSFEGKTYNLASDPYAQVNFNNGSFLGLDFAVASAPSPTFISGFFDLNEAFFSYDLSGSSAFGRSGTGGITFTLRSNNPATTPEPTAVMGLLIFGSWGYVCCLSRQKKVEV